MHWTVLMAWVKKYVASAMEAIDLSAYMKKGVDYVTAGKKSGTTLGAQATAEGTNTRASGNSSHAEGTSTTASGLGSHAEGDLTTASGLGAHAEGSLSKATATHAHAEGYFSQALGNYAHAEGNSTIAQGRSQHVFGECNIMDTSSGPSIRSNYVEIVGNGTASNVRSNARTLDWSGNEWLAGTLKVGGTSYADAVEVVAVNPPTTDGTYVLKAVVTSGVATYSWVAE